MKGAFVIFCAMVVIGLILYLTDIFYYRKKRPQSPQPPLAGQVSEETDSPAPPEAPEGEVCCGMHAVCEKTNLSPVSDEIVYYDDEELDRFRGREGGSYSEEEADEFRDVMLTMRPEEVAGWSRSLQLRGIILPQDVRDELLMIVSDLRNASTV